MTEAEWLRGTQPRRMLDHLGNSADRRRLQLFGCAACRRAWPLLADDRSRHAVEVVELYADGRASDDELGRAREDSRAACVAGNDPVALAFRAVYSLAHGSPFAVNDLLLGRSTFRERRSQGLILSDIFGNPFHQRVRFTTSWRTPTAVGIAQQMYDARDFAAMPILADALQDAGCEDEQVLAHSRGAGPHVRGCWVVDRVLGKG